MSDKELEKVIVFVFLNHKHKWVAIPGIARASGLPQTTIEEFIKHTDLLKRAKKKNRRGNVLYTLNDKARELYKLEENNPEEVFAKTKELLLEGRLREAIDEYYTILKGERGLLPHTLTSLYKSKLNQLANKYYQLEGLWKSEQISTQERFEASDKFIFRLYESILEIEAIVEEINKYKYTFKNVAIKIDRDFAGFQEEDSRAVLQNVATLLNVPVEEIAVKNIQAGSVVMTLEFDNSEQAETLYLLIKMGKLKQEGVFDAKLKMLSDKIQAQQQQKESSLLKICQEAKQKIRKGKAGKAIELLIDNLQLIGKSFQNQLYLLSADLENVIEKANLGLENFKDVRIMRNKITYALLELIDKIKGEEAV